MTHDTRTRAERIEHGRELRSGVPRSEHAAWRTSDDRRHPIEILEASNRDRIPELIPIRYGRMLKSPFTFLRGSAALMASDHASLPASGEKVQACGDCHLLNFGLFATPERNLVFDINDFDETLPAPWEWDIKRLVTSFVTAGRDQGVSDADCREIVTECVRAYRARLREYSQMSPLEVWYTRLDADTIINLAPNTDSRKRREEIIEKARQRVIDHLFPKIVEQQGEHFRIVDQPPLIYHIADAEVGDTVHEGLEDYRDTLPDERRVLFDRYRLEDYVIKAVGIGSVGTRCLLLLLMSPENHPLFLQVKEARRSVLEPYTDPSPYDNQGQRVVVGQRLTQSSSDIFLGWVRGRKGNDFYVRQLRDMKMSAPVENVTAKQLQRYAELCGWTLARSHAKSGDPAIISGYLGKGDQFDEAMSRFGIAYADQTEQDHAALVQAVRIGRVTAIREDDD